MYCAANYGEVKLYTYNERPVSRTAAVRRRACYFRGGGGVTQDAEIHVNAVYLTSRSESTAYADLWGVDKLTK